MSTLFAKERVDRFYDYLNTEKLLIFNDTVEVSRADAPDATPSDPMVYVYVSIASLVVICTIVFFIIAIVLVIKKSSFK